VALILGLIRSLEAFEIELVLGRPIGLEVFSTKIFSFLTVEPPQFASASALGSFFLLVLWLLVFCQRYFLKHKSYTTISGRGFSTRLISLGRWRYPALGFVLVIALCTTLVPICSLFLATFMKLFGYFDIAEPWTLDNWKQVLQDPILLRSLQNTLMLGVSAAGFGIILSSAIAYIIVKTKFRGRALLDFLSWIPWSIPRILLGMALASSLLLIHGVLPIYGTMGALVLAMAIAGLPPFGIFMSEFLVVSSTFAREPLLALPLVFGLIVGFGALLLRLNGLAFGVPTGSTAPSDASYVPLFAHVALVLAAGLYLPPPLVAWFQHVAGMLG